MTVTFHKMARTKTGKYASRYAALAAAKLGDEIEKRGKRYAMSAIPRAGKLIKAWTGFGDYNVSMNSLISSSTPTTLSTKQVGRATIIKFREFLGDITLHASIVGEFKATTFVINPGNVTAFPWLSSIALNYDQYKALGVIFEFVTTTSDNSTTGAIGSVLMATQYDINDDTFETKNDMMNSAYSNECKLSESALHGIECDPTELTRNIYYTKASGSILAANNDSSDYDMAKFTIATDGGDLPVRTKVGSLYVTYEFALFKERIYSGLKAQEVLQWVWTLEANEFSPGLNFALIGAAANQTGGRSNTWSFTTNTIRFPLELPGAYYRLMIVGSYNADVVAAAAPTCTYTRCEQGTQIPAPLSTGAITQAPHDIPNLSTEFIWINEVKVDPSLSSPATAAFSNFPLTSCGVGQTVRIHLYATIIYSKFNTLLSS